MIERREGDAFEAGSVASQESGDTDHDGPDIAEREKLLAESNFDEQDADLSVAFTNLHDRVADKT